MWSEAARLERAGTILFLPLLLLSCQPASRAPRERLLVASIGPLADWARHVAGPRWEVRSLLPPGANPHNYEFRPRDLGSLERASLALKVGAGLDPFMDRLVAVSHVPQVFTLAEGQEIIQGNPHLWLDPRVARQSLDRIAAQLVRVDPADSAGFRTRARAYGAAVESVDAEYRAAAAQFRIKEFVSFHPAWLYLARRYGLRQAGSIEPGPGREPGPADWSRLLAQLQQSGARAVFTESQYAPRLPAALASDAQVRVLVLDDLGSTAQPDGESYVTLMRRNLSTLREGLQ